MVASRMDAAWIDWGVVFSAASILSFRKSPLEATRSSFKYSCSGFKWGLVI
ncbi:hypothetical protein D3C76_1744490 [compost metagenome]